MKVPGFRYFSLLPAFILFLSVFIFPALDDGAAAKETSLSPFKAAGKSVFHEPGNPQLDKILSVVRQQVKNDSIILEKTEEKLTAMGRDDIYLINSLCDRMQESSGKAGEDIAFLLITALIVTF